MKVTTILGYEFTTLQSLKSFALLHDIIPIGNKSLKATWVEAVTLYLAAQNATVAMVVEADPIASEIATTVENTAVSIGSLVVKALTSEAAVLAYRVVIKTIAFALVMVWLLTVSLVKWCWAHRSSTAVYHWIKAAARSEFALSAVTYLMLGEWVLVEWIDSIRSAISSTLGYGRGWVDGIVGEARSIVG